MYLSIITHNQSDLISRLKLQVDGGNEFLKISLNIVSINPGSLYSVIAMDLLILKLQLYLSGIS